MRQTYVREDHGSLVVDVHEDDDDHEDNDAPL